MSGEIIDYVMNETAFSEVDLDQLVRTVPGEGAFLYNEITRHGWKKNL